MKGPGSDGLLGCCCRANLLDVTITRQHLFPYRRRRRCCLWTFQRFFTVMIIAAAAALQHRRAFPLSLDGRRVFWQLIFYCAHDDTFSALYRAADAQQQNCATVAQVPALEAYKTSRSSSCMSFEMDNKQPTRSHLPTLLACQREMFFRQIYTYGDMIEKDIRWFWQLEFFLLITKDGNHRLVIFFHLFILLPPSSFYVKCWHVRRADTQSRGVWPNDKHSCTQATPSSCCTTTPFPIFLLLLLLLLVGNMQMIFKSPGSTWNPSSTGCEMQSGRDFG